MRGATTFRIVIHFEWVLRKNISNPVAGNSAEFQTTGLALNFRGFQRAESPDGRDLAVAPANFSALAENLLENAVSSSNGFCLKAAAKGSFTDKIGSRRFRLEPMA